MSNQREIEQLHAELGAIDALLAELPEEGSALERLGLESRRDELAEQLRVLQAHSSTRAAPATVSLVFGGKPVIGDSAIDARFAADRLRDYQELIALIHADRLGSLRARGAVPHRDDTRLVVTGIEHGCFGFRLEEQAGSLAGTNTGIADDINTLSQLLEGAATSEPEFLALASTLSSRVLAKLTNFFGDMDDSSATISIEAPAQIVSLNRAQMRKARSTTEHTTVEQREIDGLRVVGAGPRETATGSVSVAFRHAVSGRMEMSVASVVGVLSEAEREQIGATFGKALELDVGVTIATANGKTRSSYEYRWHAQSPFNKWFDRLRALQSSNKELAAEPSAASMDAAFIAARDVLERLWLHHLDAVESIHLDADGGVGIYLGEPTKRYIVLLCDLDGSVGVLCTERGGESTAWDIPAERAATDSLEPHVQRMATFLKGES